MPGLSSAERSTVRTDGNLAFQWPVAAPSRPAVATLFFASTTLKRAPASAFVGPMTYACFVSPLT